MCPYDDGSGDVVECDGMAEHATLVSCVATRGHPRTYCGYRMDWQRGPHGASSDSCWVASSGLCGASSGHRAAVSDGRHVEASSEHHAEANNGRREVNCGRRERANNGRSDQALAGVVYERPHVEYQVSSHVFSPGGYL